VVEGEGEGEENRKSYGDRLRKERREEGSMMENNSMEEGRSEGSGRVEEGRKSEKAWETYNSRRK